MSRLFASRLFYLWVLLAVVVLAACRPPQRVLKVQKLIRDGEFERALVQARQTLRRHPHDSMLWKLLVHIHLARDDVKAAVAAYRLRAKKGGEDDQLLRYMGLMMMRWGMQHRDPEVRLDAVQGARKTDAAALVRDMIERMSDPDQVIRTWAAVAMSRAPQGAQALEDQLRSPNASARAIAVEQVGRIGKTKVINALIPYLADPSPQVRAAAARGLSHADDPSVVARLAPLCKDPSWQVQVAAARALARLERAAGASAVEPLLQSPQLAVKLAAINALAELRQKDAAAMLRKVATGGDLAAALQAGVRLAGLDEPQPVLDAIGRALKARKWETRAAACNAASRVKQAELVREALRDPEPRVRAAAARALLASGARSAERGMRPVVKAAVALHNLACPADTLVAATSSQPASAPASRPAGSPATALCVQAAELMALAAQPQGLATLLRLVQPPHPRGVRLQALELALRHRKSYDLALSLLADKDGRVAVAAAIWLFAELK